MVYKVITGILIISLAFVSNHAPAQAATVSPQCAALATKQQKLNDGIAAKEALLKELRSKITFNNAQAHAVLKTKVGSIQKESDQKVETIFKKLNAKAKNQSQKAAVLAYETEFKAALKTLRTSQAAARGTYLSNTNNLTAVHRAVIDNQVTELKKQVGAAFTTANAQCRKLGITKVTAQLVTEVKLAQNRYNTVPNVNVGSLQPQLQAASDSFRSGSDKAVASYKQSVQLSKAKLKTAFGNTKYIFE